MEKWATQTDPRVQRVAQLKNDNSKQKPLNILARIARLFSLGNQVKQLDTNENFADLKT